VVRAKSSFGVRTTNGPAEANNAGNRKELKKKKKTCRPIRVKPGRGAKYKQLENIQIQAGKKDNKGDCPDSRPLKKTGVVKKNQGRASRWDWVGGRAGTDSVRQGKKNQKRVINGKL